MGGVLPSKHGTQKLSPAETSLSQGPEDTRLVVLELHENGCGGGGIGNGNAGPLH